MDQTREASQDLVSRLRDVLGARTSIPLHEPYFGGNEEKYVLDCVKTGWVSSVGQYVEKFEDHLRKVTGSTDVIAVSNGTVAIQVALVLAGVRPGDEVIVPTLSFVATANAVVHSGATPHFVDSDVVTLGMSPTALQRELNEVVEVRDGEAYNVRTGRRISAVVPMHTFGHPMDIGSISEIARSFGIIVVEDAAEGLGSSRGGSHVGTTGLLGTLSFNGNKTITTGGGGAIITNHRDLGGLAKHLTTTAKLTHPYRYVHDAVAWNFRMPNLNAALGVAQMEQLPKILEAKRALAYEYRDIFTESPFFEFVSEPVGTTSNYWLSAVRMKSGIRADIDSVILHAVQMGLGCRPVWNLLHTLPMYEACPAAPTPNASDLSERLINVPSSPGLRIER